MILDEGDKSVMSSHRPISLASVVGKNASLLQLEMFVSTF